MGLTPPINAPNGLSTRLAGVVRKPLVILGGSPRKVGRAVGLAVALLAVGALIDFLLEHVTHSPAWQGRFVIWVLFAQTGALVVLAVRAFDLVNQIRSQHKATTYVATVEGFLDTLAIGAENGGLPLETRRLIYKAAKEQFRWYHEVMGDDDRKTMQFGGDMDEKIARAKTDGVGVAELF